MTMSTSLQTYWSLRTDNVNLCDITLLPHHQPIREIGRSSSHTLGCPSLTLPLKMPCWNPLGRSGFLSTRCPGFLIWRLTINAALSFTTTWCQLIGFTARRLVDPSFGSIKDILLLLISSLIFLLLKNIFCIILILWNWLLVLWLNIYFVECSICIWKDGVTYSSWV